MPPLPVVPRSDGQVGRQPQGERHTGSLPRLPPINRHPCRRVSRNDSVSGKGLRGFLRYIVPDSREDAVRVGTRELRTIGRAVRVRTIEITGNGDRGTAITGRAARRCSRSRSVGRPVPGSTASGSCGSRWRRDPRSRRLPRCVRTSHHRSAISVRRSSRSAC